ncbi:MAG: GtrA family protein [Desulfatitalea sp.]
MSVHPKKILFVRFCRFSGVGILNTLLHLLFFSGCYLLGLHYLLCQALAFLGVNLITFYINRTWTFGSTDSRVGEQLRLYFLTRSITLGVTLVQTVVLVEWAHFSPFLCQVTAVAINVTLNFIFSEIFVFKPAAHTLNHYLYFSYVDLERLRSAMPVTVFYIVPLFNEHHRVYPPSIGNPHGEDFVRVKVEQLEALRARNPLFDWRLIFIDDGDHRNHSGRLVRDRIQELYPDRLTADRLQVWFLDELAPEIASVSRKGGAVITAMRQLACFNPRPTDIVVYTDADLSSDLRLSGSLIAPLLKGADLCLSSRWHDLATVVDRGVKQKISSWIYNLLVFLLLRLDFTDTQNGFKAIRYDTVCLILPCLREIGFAFDTEILMLTELFGKTIEEIPIYWKDSSAESNVSMWSDPLKAFRGLLRQRRYRRCLVRANPAAASALRLKSHAQE